MSHEKNIVKKPWGYEYLMYENEKAALWLLYIKNGERTSVHCHPNKTTGLILLDGKVEVSFLSDKKVLEPLSKIMIRKGLFHSTQAIDDEGAFVLEIETPVDKQDLVRLKDSYGREGKPYEDSSFEYPKLDDCIWLSEPPKDQTIEYKVRNTSLKVYNISSVEFFNNFKEEKNVMFLKGGILTDYNIYVAATGDVVSTPVLKKLVNVFSKLEENTIVMVIDKHD